MTKEISDKHKLRQVWNSFKYCMTLSWLASKTYTCLQLSSRIITALIPVATAWNTKKILDLFGNEDQVSGPSGVFFMYMFFLLCLYLLRLLSVQIETYASAMQQDLLMRYIECEMARTAVEMELEYFDNPAYYDAFEAVKRDIYSILGAVYDGISIISYGISVCSCVFFLTGIAPLYTVVILILYVPEAVSEYSFTKKVYLWGLDHVREERQMQYFYRTATERAYAQEVRLYNIGKYLINKYQSLWRDYFFQKRSVAKKRLAWNLLLSILPEFLSTAALAHVGMSVLAGENTIGDFTLYSGMLAQMAGGLQIVVSAFMALYEKKLKIDHFSDFRKFVCKKLRSGNRILSKPVDIEFQDVSFCYPGTEKYVLKNVSFRLPAGKKLCIVGENGAGKSTILKLLLHFYEPDKGEILINGLPMQEYNVESLRSQFSCFFQNASNFAFTLRENIRISQIGKPDEDAKARQERAMRMAGADKLVQIFPQGEDTCLTRAYSDKGVELSGGQNQKVALARMFYRDASVLVLDEPTAALDPRGEYELFQTLQKECRDQSLLFVSHRLSNVFLADKIMVMENGRICASGKHDELLKTCDLYRQLFHYQADKYVMREEDEDSGH
ncbi:MAG: ABC transporter ATP-binding protein [Eubacteriales bacterium]|nr:ABC transporter ATP-binding protein [Eubacteriales bacterium]